MMIVVEGPDGSGKSSLVRRLHDLTGLKVHHRGGPPETWEIALSQMSRTFTQKGMILDRTIFVSEIVYGRAMRGETIVDEELLWEGLRRLVAIDALFIFCLPPIHVLHRSFDESINVKKSWKSDAHCKAVNENFDRIVNEYEYVYSWLRNHGARVMRYEWEKKGGLNGAVESQSNEDTGESVLRTPGNDHGKGGNGVPAGLRDQRDRGPSTRC